MAPPKKKQPVKTGERPKSIVLTAMQEKFVDATLHGKTKEQAAHEAGYANPYMAGANVEKSEAVRLALKEARDELSSAAQISRADVLDGFMEAINLARLSADPATMIKGWSEVGKMLGYYAPETKKIELSANTKRLQSKYEAMTDEELMRVIEGEAERVD